MIDLPEVIEGLSSRVDALEQRISELEHRSEMIAAPMAAPASLETAGPTTEETATEQVSGVFPLLGKAMLGIAGAYVLRALAESTSLPRQAIAAVAIAYALAWLVAASRTAGAKQFAGAVYAGTSALILAPMLWELTLRFNVLPPMVAAGVLAAFVAAATALAWKQDRPAMFSVAYGAAALAALALSVVTHDMVPFTVLLLAMVLVCEIAATRNRGRAVRPVVSAVADMAVWALIFVYNSPQSTRVDYPKLGTAALLVLACALFAMDAASIALKTMLLKQKITIFETIQAMVAFFLAACSVYFFMPQSSAAIVGVVCLLLSGACYTAVFGLFRHPAEPRNFQVFSLWSAGLFLAGVFWSLPAGWTAATLGLASLTIIAVAVRLGCKTLELHGVMYLAAAVLASGLLTYAFEALAGQMPSRPGWSVFVVSACAVLCYAAGRERPGEGWREQVLHLVPAALAVCAVAALMARGILWLAALGMTPDVFHVALIRTLTICCIALALAFGGSRWRRLEMTRVAYAAVAFVAAKLLFEDLRHGRMEFIAASIFLFALTLIGVPRLARMGTGRRTH
jgi:hypothetical protein